MAVAANMTGRRQAVDFIIAVAAMHRGTSAAAGELLFTVEVALNLPPLLNHVRH